MGSWPRMKGAGGAIPTTHFCKSMKFFQNLWLHVLNLALPEPVGDIFLHIQMEAGIQFAFNLLI